MPNSLRDDFLVHDPPARRYTGTDKVGGGRDVLYADQGDAGTAALVLVSSIVGGGVAWVTKMLLDLRTQRRKESKEDEDTAVGRLEKLLDRVDKERVELREEVRKLEEHAQRLIEELHETRVEAVRANDWIRYQESLLDAHGVTYRKWEPPAADVPPGERPDPPVRPSDPPTPAPGGHQ
jgi:hypothetical protein